VWTAPRETVDRVLRADAAGLVIAVAWLSGVLDVLQTSALRGSLKPHWGPFVGLLAMFMGPLLGFAYFEVAGTVAASMGRLLGGVGHAAETRVALACGTIVELVALPLWVPVLAVYGLEMFTTERSPAPAGLLAFAGLQALLWLWAWGLRIACLAEVHDFSIVRAVLTVLLAWLAVVVVIVGAVIVLGTLVGK
jgi:hypothetical protein